MKRGEESTELAAAETITEAGGRRGAQPEGPKAGTLRGRVGPPSHALAVEDAEHAPDAALCCGTPAPPLGAARCAFRVARLVEAVTASGTLGQALGRRLASLLAAHHGATPGYAALRADGTLK